MVLEDDPALAAPGRALQLRALWVDPALEDRMETACCLLYFLLQYLLAVDGVARLAQGAWDR